MNKNENILIIDGNGLAYKCLHAHQTLGFINENKEFIYTGIPYGFLTNLLFLNKEFKPDKLCIVWDGKPKRRELFYPNYKKRRKEKRKEQIEKNKILDQENKNNPNYKPQHNVKNELGYLFSILKNTGIIQYYHPEEEADDIIGTLSKKLSKTDKVCIISNDHDFYQLLNNNVQIFRSIGPKKEIITNEKFKQEYGFDPKFYVNVLALGDDKTDEYHGIRGISEESAIMLIKEFGPELEKIYNKSLSNLLPTRYNNLIKEKFDQAKLCRKLAKIITKIDNIENMTKDTYLNIDELKNQFKEFRFHSLLFDDKFNSILEIPRKKIL